MSFWGLIRKEMFYILLRANNTIFHNQLPHKLDQSSTRRCFTKMETFPNKAHRTEKFHKVREIWELICASLVINFRDSMQDCKRRKKTRLIWERWRESGSIVRHEVSFEREKERMQPSWDTRLFRGLRESASAAWDEVVTRQTYERVQATRETRLLPEIRECASVPRDEVCRAAIREGFMWS
jgi:hypothetical protein